MPTTISGAAGVNNVAPDSINFEDFKTTLFNGLLSGNGYIKIPVNDQGVERELIVQWGYVPVSSSTTSVVWPIEFPNECLTVSFIDRLDGDSSGLEANTALRAAASVTGASFSTNASITGFHYLVVGY